MPCRRGAGSSSEQAGESRMRPRAAGRRNPLAWLRPLIALLIIFSQLGLSLSQAVDLQHLDNPGAQLQACYSQPRQPDGYRGATFKGFLEGQHPWLELHSAWWSRKQPCADDDSTAGDGGGVPPRNPIMGGSDPECALTVATTLTLSRISALEQLCLSWPGPLAAALYVPLELSADEDTPGAGLSPANLEKLTNTTQSAQMLFDRMEAAGSRACALRLLVLTERLAEPVMHMLLPINSLRNAALLAARSPLVSMIDVDLIISSTLGQALVTSPPEERRQRSAELISACREHSIMILPALEPHTGRRMPQSTLLQWAERSIKGDKAALKAMVDAQEMCFFQQLSYPRGHRLTNFPRWFGTRWPYTVRWALFYEPWFIIARAANPWYDVRFQGYGYNKQNHVAHLAADNFRFQVHPDAFVVHRPHDKTKVQRLYVVALNERARARAGGHDIKPNVNFSNASQLSAADVGALLQSHVNAVFTANQAAMRIHGYRPQIDVQTQSCLLELAWWQQSVRSGV